ncbi:MAG: hypothetical protein ACREBD_40115, partial [Blastocatellia bacterium]
ARVPALLGFILQLWRKRGSVPSEILDDKLELYAQITLELAQQLDREKEGIAPEREWLVEDKDGSLKLDLLRQLAFNQLFRGLIHPPYEVGSDANDVDRLVFTSEQLRAEAVTFARTLKEREGHDIIPRNLAEDVKATALLRQVGADHYAFAHLTLQEYLAAWQLAKRHDAATCERIFCRAYFNPTLAEMEVLPITLGLVDEPDKLYGALEHLPESLDFKGLRVLIRGTGIAKVSTLMLTNAGCQVGKLFSDEDYKTNKFVPAILDSLLSVTGQARGILLRSIIKQLPNGKAEFLEREDFAGKVSENDQVWRGVVRIFQDWRLLDEEYRSKQLNPEQESSSTFVRFDDGSLGNAAEIVAYSAQDESAIKETYQQLSNLILKCSEGEDSQIAFEALRKFERKLQYFDIPIPTTTPNDPSPPSPPPPLTAQEQAELETRIAAKYQETLRGGDARQKGKALEELLAALFASIPGFTVSESNYHTATEEIDLVVR